MSELFRLTSKLFVRRSDNHEDYLFFCPGCKEVHPFSTKVNGKSVWLFDGNTESPSFNPSLLLDRHLTDYEGCGPRCHSIVTKGKISFCSDCEHGLVGQTVDMVEIPEDWNC